MFASVTRFIRSAIHSPPRIPHTMSDPYAIRSHPRLFTSSSRDTDLLRKIQTLRERAIDMEARTTAALERLGELPPPRTPLAQVVHQIEGVKEGEEWAEQPSPVTDVRDWVEGFVERMKDIEVRLVESRKKEVEEGGGGDELQNLMEEASNIRSEATHFKGQANEPIRRGDDEEEVKLGPIPHSVAAQHEPVWIAVPLRGDDVEDVTASTTKEGRGEEKEGAPDVISPLDRKEGKEVRVEGEGMGQPSHVRKELPEDQPVGIPSEERGPGKHFPMRGPTRRTRPSPRA